MGSLNSCTFIGNLGRDPEVKFTTGGQPVANFSIACNETFKDRAGEKQERVEWVNLVAFGKTAELCKLYLSKGRQVYVEGRMQTRKWDDKEGNKRSTTEVVVNKVIFLGGGESRGGESRHEDGGGGGYGNPEPIDDSDVPF